MCDRRVREQVYCLGIARLGLLKQQMRRILSLDSPLAGPLQRDVSQLQYKVLLLPRKKVHVQALECGHDLMHALPSPHSDAATALATRAPLAVLRRHDPRHSLPTLRVIAALATRALALAAL